MPHGPIVVDAHSHVFNAEDLPIDGFIKQLSPAPKLLTGLVSVPLDALAQWLAEGSSKEIARIEHLLRGDDAFESLDDDRWMAGIDPITHHGGDGFEGLEAADDTMVEEELAAEIANASAGDQRELDVWLDEEQADLEAIFGDMKAVTVRWYNADLEAGKRGGADHATARPNGRNRLRHSRPVLERGAVRRHQLPQRQPGGNPPRQVQAG